MSYSSFKLPKERSIFSLSIALARIRAVVRNVVTHLERVEFGHYAEQNLHYFFLIVIYSYFVCVENLKEGGLHPVPSWLCPWHSSVFSFLRLAEEAKSQWAN